MRYSLLGAVFFAVLISGALFASADDSTGTNAPTEIRTISEQEMAKFLAKDGALETVVLSNQYAAAGQNSRSQSPSLERQSTTTLTYALAAPIYTGQNNNDTYIRFFNTSATQNNNFGAVVYGSPSGRQYGQGYAYSFFVRPLASVQYSIQDIFQNARLTVGANGAPTLMYGDTSWYLIISTSFPTGAFQNVIYNGSTGFYENASLCLNYLPNISTSRGFLMNVHTSALPAYPAQIYFYNLQNSSALYQVTVVDAATGNTMGAVNITVAANALYSVPETFFEQSVGWTPTSTQYHTNLIFQNLTQSTFNAKVEQFIFNQQLSAYINMTTACTIPSSVGVQPTSP